MPLRHRTRAEDYVTRIKTLRAQHNQQRTRADPDPPPTLLKGWDIESRLTWRNAS
jgi:hypothetical protein